MDDPTPRERRWLLVGRVLEWTVCPLAHRLNMRRPYWPAAWAWLRARGSPAGSVRSLLTGGERQ